MTNARPADAAKPLFQTTPDVQQCYFVTGWVTFVLTRDMRSYEALTRRLFAENESVERYRTLVALDRVKAGMELVVP